MRSHDVVFNLQKSEIFLLTNHVKMLLKTFKVLLVVNLPMKEFYCMKYVCCFLRKIRNLALEFDLFQLPRELRIGVSKISLTLGEVAAYF